MKALILGSGLSGKSAYQFLKSAGYEVSFATEEDINDGSKIGKNQYTDRLLNGLSFIVNSPGINLECKLCEEAQSRKIKIIGELELGLGKTQGDIIAVTGTNGKTTTVSLINFLLLGENRRTYLGGNIGTPVTSFASCTKKEDIVVLECSSYQLENISKIHAHIAMILNITPDHLTRHKTMDNYMLSKYNICKNQTKDDYLLINADSELLMKYPPKTDAKIYYFSTKRKVTGCYIKSGCIYFNDNQKQKKLISLSGIKLLGEHNLSNILASCLAVYLETGNTNILKRVSNFQGVEHRNEYVQTIRGVAFYNDSKATNIASTLVALKSFKCKINLILGGSEKGYDFDELYANLTPNVANIAVFGQTKPKILYAAKKYNYENIYSCDTLKACTKLLFNLAKSGEIILLSPACASFDHFKNYEERGSVFKKIVGEIAQNETDSSETNKET